MASVYGCGYQEVGAANGWSLWVWLSGGCDKNVLVSQ